MFFFLRGVWLGSDSGDTQGTHSAIGICVFSVQRDTLGTPVIPRVLT